MNCTVCGAQIPMGQPNCPNCGAMVQQAQPMGGYQQPVQPMGGYQQPAQPMGGYQQPAQPMGGYQQPAQPMGGYQQPMQPMGGYQQPVQPAGAGAKKMMGALNGGIMNKVALVGAFLIALTPFLTWCQYKIEVFGYKESDSANLFGLAGGDVDEGIFILLGILLVLSGLGLMMYYGANFAPQLDAIKAKVASIPFIDFILAGVALLCIIIALCNGTVNDIIEAADSVGKGSHGIGPVVGILGVIASIAPKALDMLGIKIGK